MAVIAGILAQAKGEPKQRYFNRIFEPCRSAYKPMLRLHPLKLSVIAAILMALLLTGCGRKGPLYLPDSPSKPGHKQPKN